MMNFTVFLKEEGQSEYQEANDWWSNIIDELGFPAGHLPSVGDSIAIDDDDVRPQYEVKKRTWYATTYGGDHTLAGLKIYVEHVTNG